VRQLGGQLHGAVGRSGAHRLIDRLHGGDSGAEHPNTVGMGVGKQTPVESFGSPYSNAFGPGQVSLAH
jgi:hypothetical protein